MSGVQQPSEAFGTDYPYRYRLRRCGRSREPNTARYPLDGYTYPVETTVRYAVTIPADELSGESINEAALVDADGDLAAIKTMFTKRKDAGVIFTFEFDDEF